MTDDNTTTHTHAIDGTTTPTTDTDTIGDNNKSVDLPPSVPATPPLRSPSLRSLHRRRPSPSSQDLTPSCRETTDKEVDDPECDEDRGYTWKKGKRRRHGHGRYTRSFTHSIGVPKRWWWSSSSSWWPAIAPSSTRIGDTNINDGVGWIVNEAKLGALLYFPLVGAALTSCLGDMYHRNHTLHREPNLARALLAECPVQDPDEVWIVLACSYLGIMGSILVLWRAMLGRGGGAAAVSEDVPSRG